MQMMPATARETARRASLPFDWPRLGRDPLYSAQMGAAHLNDLLKEWRGSYILTFAAYNAGSGNVRKWIEAYGDPRKPEVDAVDWIERIPFYETRNYVQRVMENLQVYRQRLNQRTAYLIDHDLKRGGRRD
jgi:soluble lytic murein transglycosylase